MTTIDDLQQLQQLVKQLRAEASIQRIKVSAACYDLIEYCQTHEAADMLLHSTKQQTHFKNKGSKCFPARR